MGPRCIRRWPKPPREEGFEKLAFLFDGVGKIEKEHEERYLTLLKNLEEGVVFKRGDEYVWKCRNCGHLHVGPEHPRSAPSATTPSPTSSSRPSTTRAADGPLAAG